uniref:BTB domain-containing protein n=1 Tax=Panagrolaimus sp. ES5 TaxID=591445 RepID=A0AC34GS64_9BILA
MSSQEEQIVSGTLVPFNFEWIFDGNLHGDEPKCLTDYMFDKFEETPLSSSSFLLPCFNGIKYYLSYFLFEDPEDNTELHLALDFKVEIDYNIHDIDVRFVSTIDNNYGTVERREFNEGLNYAKKNIRIKACYNAGDDGNCRCIFCACGKFSVRIEGTFNVKNVDGLPLTFEVPDESKLLFDRNDEKDFIIVAENQEIHVHKSILLQNSDALAAMFNSQEWKESGENKYAFKDIPYKLVKIAVNACYGIEYRESFQKEEYLLLYKFADMYMEKLKQALKKSLVLTPQNVVEYANFFSQNHYDDLVICCIDYILACTQHSFSVKDTELLDAQIHTMFFKRFLTSPVLKKELKADNILHVFDRPLS